MAEAVCTGFPSIASMLQQLRDCGYQCEAGRLEDNVAFKALEKHASFVDKDSASAADLIATQAKFTYDLALNLLVAGHKLTRAGWNGTGMWVRLQVPDEHSKMQHPYFYIHPVDGKLRPWNPTTTDQLAGDWMVIE